MQGQASRPFEHHYFTYFSAFFSAFIQNTQIHTNNALGKSWADETSHPLMRPTDSENSLPSLQPTTIQQCGRPLGNSLLQVDPQLLTLHRRIFSINFNSFINNYAIVNHLSTTIKIIAGSSRRIRITNLVLRLSRLRFSLNTALSNHLSRKSDTTIR